MSGAEVLGTGGGEDLGTGGARPTWRARAPGKLILLGEHAVVFGEPALAAALPLGVEVELSDDDAGPRLLLDAPSATTPAEAIDGLRAIAEAADPASPRAARVLARVRSDIPLGAGLGSSAALGVALARALCARAGRPCPPELAARLALEFERPFHGAPSGVDPAACAQDGVILFRRGGEGAGAGVGAGVGAGAGAAGAASIRSVVPGCPVPLVVAFSGVERRTRSTVMPLRDRAQAHGEVYRPLLAALGVLTRAGAGALEAGDLRGLGVRFDAAHALLAGLGVSCPELDVLVARLGTLGALGAKLTGAGGGGAAIGLFASAAEAERAVLSLREGGGQAFAVLLPASAPAQQGGLQQGAPVEVPPLAATKRRPRGAGSRWATAQAHANIALVKYWGKRDEALILPQAGSLSLALDRLLTTTMVDLSAPRDELWLDGKPAAPGELRRARALLSAAGLHEPAFIESRNDFPTGAGLASSASGFAALAVAACAAAGQERTTAQLSALARLGSGSAARSVPGGWAMWRDEESVQLHPPDHWDVRMVVASCAAGPKEVGSRDGMRACKETSPYHPAWIAQGLLDLPRATALLAARDLDGLGRLAETNALRMHADALAAEPPLLYWQPATVGCLHALARLRSQGTPAWGTIDAGPHVVALCRPEDAARVAACLREVAGVRETLECAPAGGARVVERGAP
jgi:diphosphomevalonate decarboxylase